MQCNPLVIWTSGCCLSVAASHRASFAKHLSDRSGVCAPFLMPNLLQDFQANSMEIVVRVLLHPFQHKIRASKQKSLVHFESMYGTGVADPLIDFTVRKPDNFFRFQRTPPFTFLQLKNTSLYYSIVILKKQAIHNRFHITAIGFAFQLFHQGARELAGVCFC